VVVVSGGQTSTVVIGGEVYRLPAVVRLAAGSELAVDAPPVVAEDRSRLYPPGESLLVLP
jgi:hypothetical protein